jgi:hypothetical protein
MSLLPQEERSFTNLSRYFPSLRRLKISRSRHDATALELFSQLEKLTLKEISPNGAVLQFGRLTGLTALSLYVVLPRSSEYHGLNYFLCRTTSKVKLNLKHLKHLKHLKLRGSYGKLTEFSCISMTNIEKLCVYNVPNLKFMPHECCLTLTHFRCNSVRLFNQFYDLLHQQDRCDDDACRNWRLELEPRGGNAELELCIERPPGSNHVLHFGYHD